MGIKETNIIASRSEVNSVTTVCFGRKHPGIIEDVFPNKSKGKKDAEELANDVWSENCNGCRNAPESPLTSIGFDVFPKVRIGVLCTAPVIVLEASGLKVMARTRIPENANCVG